MLKWGCSKNAKLDRKSNNAVLHMNSSKEEKYQMIFDQIQKPFFFSFKDFNKLD